MHQPPVQFAGVVARLPKAAMYAFGPVFPPLWAAARAGDLNVGEPAPDFDLDTHDHSSRVRLSSFRAASAPWRWSSGATLDRPSGGRFPR